VTALHGEYSTVIDVTVYVSSVANASKFRRKTACLENFAQGAKSVGAKVDVEYDYKYTPSRLAVILGWATTNTGGRNIALRKQIIAEQNRHGYKTMCIDASCFKYLDDAGTYLRYSIGGPFYDRAEYGNKNSSASKWNDIQSQLGISMKPRTANNGYVLLGMQRDGGFAMKSLDPLTWAKQKIAEIRQHTNREIVIRPHPGKFDMKDFSVFRTKLIARQNVRVIHPEESKLLDDLKGASSAVFFNSSASVAAVLEGIPVFVDDTSAVTWHVANHSVADIEKPKEFDRTQWINDLAAAHWSDAEGASGKIYQHFLPYL
jgi:hypothetical protein